MIWSSEVNVEFTAALTLAVGVVGTSVDVGVVKEDLNLDIFEPETAPAPVVVVVPVVEVGINILLVLEFTRRIQPP